MRRYRLGSTRSRSPPTRATRLDASPSDGPSCGNASSGPVGESSDIAGLGQIDATPIMQTRAADVPSRRDDVLFRIAVQPSRPAQAFKHPKANARRASPYSQGPDRRAHVTPHRARPQRAFHARTHA